MSRFESHQSNKRSKRHLRQFPRLIMLSIDIYDEQWPIDVCYRPLPFMAPSYFTRTIRVVTQ